MKSYRASLPVIVVGHLTVGGSGKTPLVISLVEKLQESGYKPGVISRGYGGNSSTYPLLVNRHTDPAVCGDEPALIVKRTDVPMVVGADRKADIQLLTQHFDLDCILSDDGFYSTLHCIEISRFALLIKQAKKQTTIACQLGPIASRLNDCLLWI